MSELSSADVGQRSTVGATMVVGADIGGTKLCTVLVSADREVHHSTWAEHASGTFEELLLALEDAVAANRAAAAVLGADVGAIGVSVAAWLSPDRQRVQLGVNIGARQRELTPDIRRRL